MSRVRELLDILGWPGVLGLGVLCFGTAFFFSAVRPAERELESVTHNAERMHLRAAAHPSAEPPGEDLRRFYALFPPTERIGGELERLVALARKASVELQQGEYRLEAKSAGPEAYRVSLPIRGTYPQIREFVETTLTDVPIASIDGLRFERKNAREGVLDAQVRLTIYFRPKEEL